MIVVKLQYLLPLLYHISISADNDDDDDDDVVVVVLVIPELGGKMKSFVGCRVSLGESAVVLRTSLSLTS